MVDEKEVIYYAVMVVIFSFYDIESFSQVDRR